MSGDVLEKTLRIPEKFWRNPGENMLNFFGHGKVLEKSSDVMWKFLIKSLQSMMELCLLTHIRFVDPFEHCRDPLDE